MPLRIRSQDALVLGGGDVSSPRMDETSMLLRQEIAIRANPYRHSPQMEFLRPVRIL